MNIFKKTIQHTGSLLERAEQRVIQLCLNHLIPKYKKGLLKSMMKLLGIGIFSAIFSFFILYNGVETFSFLTRLIFGFSLTINLGCVVFLIVDFTWFYKTNSFSSELSQNNNEIYGELNYDFEQTINKFNVEKFNQLNEDEVNELLSSSLSPIQLNYLKNSISRGYITLHDLKEIDRLGTIEEQHQALESANHHIQSKKEKLNTFFSKYGIEQNSNYQHLEKILSHHYLLAKNSDEKTLISRL